MAEQVLSMYLAGSIRDDRPEDFDWRERVITALSRHPVRILNPLGGKTKDAEGNWTVSSVPSGAEFITKHDLYYVKQADIVLFNFRALSQGYPNIGTLVEYGWASKDSDKLIYVIVDPDYAGHGNAKMFKLHPFIERFAAQTFATVDAAIAFLTRHVDVISGRTPRFVPPRLTLEQIELNLDAIADRSR